MLSFKKLFLLGLASSTAFAPLFWWPFLIIGFLGLSLQLRQCQCLKQAFLTGYAFSFGHFLGGLYWIAASLWIDIGKFWIWIVPCLAILPFYFSFFGGVVGIIMQSVVKEKSTFHYTFFLGFFWILSEMARSYLLLPLPWNLSAYSLGNLPALMQGAAIFGAFGLGMVIFLITSLIEILWFWRYRSFYDKCWSGLSVMGLAVLFQWGTQRCQDIDQLPASSFTVRVVQPNIEQTLKWDPQLFRQNLEKYIYLSLHQRAAEVETIIWPETVLVDFQLYDLKYSFMIASIIPPKGFLILGAQRYRKMPEVRVTNSLLILDGDLNVLNFYDKNHLVPFGEYIPLRKMFEKMGLNIAEISQSKIDMKNGKTHQTIVQGRIPPFNPLICYEVIFPHFTLKDKTRPRWIVNLTNDAWFGDTSGPYQHLTSCRFRAIEQGIPVVRAANTGISAVINSSGRILKSLLLYQSGYIDVKIPSAMVVPLYALYGDTIFFIIASGFFIIFYLLRTKKSRNL